MLRLIDWALIALMALGALGHTYGSFALLDEGSVVQVWSLAGALCAALLVALNVLRHLRPSDRPIAILSAAGTCGWLVVVLLFGKALGNYADFRVVSHGIAAAGLALLSLRVALL